MIRKLVRFADAMVNHLYLSTFSEKPSLIILLFHTVYRDDDDQHNDNLYPLISMKVSQFRKFLEHFLEIGYTLISPVDLANGLASDRRYLLLTFDDGYYNNTLALPVLQEFKAPALFLSPRIISTSPKVTGGTRIIVNASSEEPVFSRLTRG